MKITTTSTILIVIIIVSLCNFINAKPIDTVLTYEGYFWDFNEPAEGIYDLKLMLYDHNDPIVWTMVNAIKELKDENQQLREQNQQMLQRLEALEKKLE